MNEKQHKVLRVMASMGGEITPSRVAEVLEYRITAHITHSCKCLQSEGLITRQRVTHARTLMTVTDAGRAYLKEVPFFRHRPRAEPGRYTRKTDRPTFIDPKVLDPDEPGILQSYWPFQNIIPHEQISALYQGQRYDR